MLALKINFNNCTFILKMRQCNSNFICNIIWDNKETPNSFCKLWASRIHCDRQWKCLYQQDIWSFTSTKWNTANQKSPISHSIEWYSWKNKLNFQKYFLLVVQDGCQEFIDNSNGPLKNGNKMVQEIRTEW